MIKIKEIKVEKIEDILEKQNELLEEDENYTFRIIPVFLTGYSLEVYLPKEYKLYDMLNGFYNSFREEVQKLEDINKK